MLNFIGNILWFILIGLWSGIAWGILGILWCVTIIGIPVGIQCFKLAGLSFLPFGKDIVFSQSAGKFVVNILWLVFGGIELAAGYLAAGIVFCITIIGIPFGCQCFKLMKLALLPLGASVIEKGE